MWARADHLKEGRSVGQPTMSISGGKSGNKEAREEATEVAEVREMMMELEEVYEQSDSASFKDVDANVYAVRKREELTFIICPSFPSVFL